MGETANNIINGSCCVLCGQYFHKFDCIGTYSHGYPVACYECYTKDCGYPKAVVKTI